VSSFPLWAAIRTVKSKLGTWAGYEHFQQLTPEVTRAEWARAIGEAKQALSMRASELTRPLNRRPVGAEISRYTSVRQTGFLQQIDVYVRDRDTGLIESRPYTIKTQTLRSRQNVVNEGLSRYQNAIDTDPSNYPEDVLGAAYVGTYELVPG
jgi:hypothetical protein